MLRTCILLSLSKDEARIEVKIEPLAMSQTSHEESQAGVIPTTLTVPVSLVSVAGDARRSVPPCLGNPRLQERLGRGAAKPACSLRCS